jgi:glycosyltransferase involved in cell wall biosynthesis
VKVLAVSASLPWLLSDGNSLILHHQFARLAARHEIRVLVAGGPSGGVDVPAPESGLPEGVTVRWFGTGRPPLVDYVARRAVSLRTGEPAHVYWVERPELVASLRREVAAWQPDVLHLQTWGTAQLSRLAPGVPAVHVAVDSWLLGYQNRPLPRWRRLADTGELERIRRHEARHYPGCSAVVVVAPKDAAAVLAVAPGADVHVIANGVDPGPEPGPVAASPSAPVLGYHGNFDTVATEDGAIALVRDVLPAVRRRHADATARLIGRNPGPAVAALRSEEVEVTGPVDDVRAALRPVSIYVAAMTAGSGLKNKVLEAMAAGLPVVATEAACDGIGAGGGVIAVHDVGEIAAEVVRLLDDPGARMRLGRANRLRALREFTWDRNAEQLEALWERAAR